jgi:hypothetical protein
VIALRSAATLRSVELECITRNLPDVALNMFLRLKYLIRLAFLTVFTFIFHSGTQIIFLNSNAFATVSFVVDLASIDS